MKKANGAWIGLIFLIVGFLYACSALDIFHFTIFFPGFWTLFIIVPCFYGLFKKGEDKTGYIIGLIIGVCFLINAQGFDFRIDFWPMILAIVCLLIGIKLIFPNKKKKKPHIDVSINMGENGEKTVHVDGKTFDNATHKTNNGYLNVSAILGGREVRMENEVFTGGDVCAVLGGVEIDLRRAVITEDVYLQVTSVLGGIDLYMPANVKVISDNCTAILGGVDTNRDYVNVQGPDAPKVIISGTCILGGIDIH